jgi:hypothetical protein
MEEVTIELSSDDFEGLADPPDDAEEEDEEVLIEIEAVASAPLRSSITMGGKPFDLTLSNLAGCCSNHL